MLETILGLHFNKQVERLTTLWDGDCCIHFFDGSVEFTDYENLFF